MENKPFKWEKKSIFENKTTKVALGLCTWVAACIRGLNHAYAGTFLRTQPSRVSEAWKMQVFCNNGWDLEWILHRLGAVLNPIFSTIKSLTRYIFKTHRNLMGKT